MLSVMSRDGGASCRGWRAGWAVVIALGWAAAVLGLAACDGRGTLPTLAPTLVPPASAPRSDPAVAPVASPFPTPNPGETGVAPEPALVVPYSFDPATGQMVPAERLSGVVAERSDQLWVMTDSAFVEYRRLQPAPLALPGTGESNRQAPGSLVAYKVITYTYDEVGRRVGWTVAWPQGPTETQRLTFLYEGLVAVGERLQIGDVVTTTYYPWATRDRNTTEDAPALGLGAPITDVTRYDARCQAAAGKDCVTLLATIIVSEASVGNEEEQWAVAWTFRNRLDRGLSPVGYAMDRTPGSEWYFELARQVLTAPAEADVTKGATHFFSPRSMPLQGEEARCKANGGVYDCDGGLVFVEGLEAPAYAPFWHLLYEWLPVSGIRKTHFLFYRIPPIRPRVGQ